jgi:hypothetical protein
MTRSVATSSAIEAIQAPLGRGAETGASSKIRLKRKRPRILHSCARFAERGNRTPLIDVNQIHYEVIRVEYFDLQMLLQMRRHKIRDVRLSA